MCSVLFLIPCFVAFKGPQCIAQKKTYGRSEWRSLTSIVHCGPQNLRSSSPDMTQCFTRLLKNVLSIILLLMEANNHSLNIKSVIVWEVFLTFSWYQQVNGRMWANYWCPCSLIGQHYRTLIYKNAHWNQYCTLGCLPILTIFKNSVCIWQ